MAQLPSYQYNAQGRTHVTNPARVDAGSTQRIASSIGRLGADISGELQRQSRQAEIEAEKKKREEERIIARARQQQERREKFAAAMAYSNADRELANAYSEAEVNAQDGPGDAFHDRHMSVVQQRLETALESIPESQREAYAVRFNDLANRHSKNAASREVRLHNTHQRQTFNNEVADSLERISRDPESVADEHKRLELFLGGMDLPDDTKEKVRRGLKNQLQQARWNTLADSDPQMVLEQLGLGANRDQAGRLPQDKTGLEAKDRERLANRAGRRLREIQRAEALELERKKMAADVRRVLSGDATVDYVGDRKAINRASELIELPEMIRNGDEQAGSVLSQIALNTGTVSDVDMSALRAKWSTGDPAQQLDALKIAAQVLRANPTALSTARQSKDIERAATYFNVLTTTMGLDENAALSRIQETQTPEFKQRSETHRKEASVLSSSLDKSDLEDDAFGADFFEFGAPEIVGGGGFSIFGTDPELGASPRRTADVMAVYRRNFEHHYVITADENLAKAAAVADLKKVYDVSSVTGTPRVMRRPPERYYPRFQGSHDYIRKQLVSDVAALAGREVPHEDIFLEATTITDQEAADMKRTGVRPSYRVVYREERDGVQYLQTAPQQWRPDLVDEARKSQARQKETERKAMDDALTERQREVAKVQRKARREKELDSIRKDEIARRSKRSGRRRSGRLPESTEGAAR